jgi:hypothetical protein
MLSASEPPFRCPECRRTLTEWVLTEFQWGTQEQRWAALSEERRRAYREEQDAALERLQPFDDAFSEWVLRWQLIQQRNPALLADQEADLARFECTWQAGYRGPEIPPESVPRAQ